MTDADGPKVNCPNCGALVIWSTAATWRPFCSDRCRLLDLGAWFSEERSIPDTESAPPIVDPDARGD